MILEEEARWLLILHALVGGATVAAATHLVVWMRGWLRGRAPRRRAVQRFAWISLALFATTFLLGNVAYPIYKVRVRAEYLDDPAAVEANLREPTPERVAAAADRTAKVARWFDVKEHWVAMGLVLALACAFILRVWDPTEPGAAAVAPLVFGLAVGAAATAWLGAIIGLLTSSFRALGPLG
ncbi:MAG TPA: hypothetical protein VMZ28_03555 [Kofleriaceae bacterium]|nr:hypothetical protein [Kofleriaceae bacterium]